MFVSNSRFARLATIVRDLFEVVSRRLDQLDAANRVLQNTIVRVERNAVYDLTQRIARNERNVVAIANAAADVERRHDRLDAVVSDEMDNLTRTIERADALARRVEILENKLAKVAVIEDANAIPGCDAALCPPECAACSPSCEFGDTRIGILFEGKLVLSMTVREMVNLSRTTQHGVVMDARGVMVVVNLA